MSDYYSKQELEIIMNLIDKEALNIIKSKTEFTELAKLKEIDKECEVLRDLSLKVFGEIRDRFCCDCCYDCGYGELCCYCESR